MDDSRVADFAYKWPHTVDAFQWTAHPRYDHIAEAHRLSENSEIEHQVRTSSNVAALAVRAEGGGALVQIVHGGKVVQCRAYGCRVEATIGEVPCKQNIDVHACSGHSNNILHGLLKLGENN